MGKTARGKQNKSIENGKLKKEINVPKRLLKRNNKTQPFKKNHKKAKLLNASAANWQSQDRGATEGNPPGDSSDAEDSKNDIADEEIAGQSEADETLRPSDNENDDDKKNIPVASKTASGKRSNDVVEGCTVFLKSVPFDTDENDLKKLCKQYGLFHYVIINRDHVSGHSKGTAFVKFKSKESADLCLQAGPEFAINGEVITPLPALSRNEVEKQRTEQDDNQAKDSRNLYLFREGLIMSGSKAADGVSAADMAKRHKLEQIKQQVLKNLNRFVSRNRLSIHNLPLNYDNEKLKQMIVSYTGFKPHECRVMREGKITRDQPEGKSKGFGFMSFNTHKEALEALRKLNNNPKIFGNVHRPIVAFSIEDRTVHNIREKRQEKSLQQNPTYQHKLENRKLARLQRKTNKKNKQQDDAKSKESLKKHIDKLEKKHTGKKILETPKQDDMKNNESFVGTVAIPGTTIGMRSKQKIKFQADVHSKRVKAENRKQKQKKIQKELRAERQEAGRTTKSSKTPVGDDLSALVNKYKALIDGANKTQVKTKLKKPKTKWYES